MRSICSIAVARSRSAAGSRRSMRASSASRCSSSSAAFSSHAAGMRGARSPDSSRRGCCESSPRCGSRCSSLSSSSGRYSRRFHQRSISRIRAHGDIWASMHCFGRSTCCLGCSRRTRFRVSMDRCGRSRSKPRATRCWALLGGLRCYSGRPRPSSRAFVNRQCASSLWRSCSAPSSSRSPPPVRRTPVSHSSSCLE